MTQETSLPSPPAEKAEPPQYYEGQITPSEKNSSRTPCSHHDPTPTPYLDAQLATPTARSAVQSINNALDNATDGEHCTRCTANDAARTLTRYLFEIRQAKKEGNWSKEDKKKLKVEVKGLMREVKGVVREEKARLKKEGTKI